MVEGHPVYRLLPPGTARTYATLRYHGRRSPHTEIAQQVRRLGGIPTSHLSAALVAARAVFRAGQDDLLEAGLTALARRFPESPAVPELWSDLAAFQGRFADALHSAERARVLQPSASSATGRVVRLGYEVLDRAEADRAAVAAVARFPRSGEVLWPACRACADPDQYQRLYQAWQRAAPEPGAVLQAVRPLANAATRGGRVDAALALYRHAIAQLAVSKRQPAPVTETVLAGRNPDRAIADLCQALDGAGVPFFFAAGTALGLVREGRPLGADGDIDVGIFDADWDREALNELFRVHRLFDLEPHPLTRKVGLRHRGGSPVDMFPFYERDGRVWHDGVFVRWYNSPFTVQRRQVGGVSVPLPADTERYLTESYGDWRTPFPGFDAFTDDAPNLEVTWPEYAQLHLLRRAYKRLAAGDRHGTAHELHRAGEDELAARIGVGHLARIDVTAPLPEPAAERARLADLHLDLARRARAGGEWDTAVEILRTALRSGLWAYARLWSELRSVMRSPADYSQIRALWMESPHSCQQLVPVLLAVARAAMVAGEHDEARSLLRKAIVLRARQAPRLRAAAHRLVRRAGRRVRPADGFEQRAAVALAALNHELGDLGVRAFLISGTLLGCLRDAAFISWDKDIDVGIFTDEILPMALEKAFDRSARFEVRRLDFNSDRLRVNHANGVMIDIFPHYRGDGGRIWHDGSATRWWNSPFGLTTIEFLGTIQYVPDPPEQYLTENYGDWRVPKPDFDARLDTPNVEVTDPALFDTLLHVSLLEAQIKDQPGRRRRYARLLRERGEGAWLDHL